METPLTSSRQPTMAILPWADRFEDFYDRIGVSLEHFVSEFTGTWLLNYVEALQQAGIRPVLYFASAHATQVMRMTHRPTGAALRVLPSPWLHRKVQGAGDRVGVDSPWFKSFKSYLATPWLAGLREMRRDGCHAILCQEYEYPRFDEAVALGRMAGLPVFATYQAANRPGSALESPFRRAAVRSAAGLVIGARSEQQRVQERYGVEPSRMAQIPNAFDVFRWHPGDRERARVDLGIPLDARVVVWQGRIEIHQKGLDVLLDAWERVVRGCQGTPPLLLIVGSGRDANVVSRRIATLPPGVTRWENRWLSDRRLLWQFLSAADLAVLSSRHEGFAVAVIEAMACALPVVATDVSGVAEAFGDEQVGVRVPPEDPAALAEALARLLDAEPLRREMGARARRRAEREFSLDVVGRRLRGFFEECGAFRGREPAVLGSPARKRVS